MSLFTFVFDLFVNRLSFDLQPAFPLSDGKSDSDSDSDESFHWIQSIVYYDRQVAHALSTLGNNSQLTHHAYFLSHVRKLRTESGRGYAAQIS